MTNKEKNQLGAIIIFAIGFMFFGYLLSPKYNATNKRSREIERNYSGLKKVEV
jgi:uncharacterized metal-binding protein